MLLKVSSDASRDMRSTQILARATSKRERWRLTHSVEPSSGRTRIPTGLWTYIFCVWMIGMLLTFRERLWSHYELGDYWYLVKIIGLTTCIVVICYIKGRGWYSSEGIFVATWWGGVEFMRWSEVVYCEVELSHWSYCAVYSLRSNNKRLRISCARLRQKSVEEVLRKYLPSSVLGL